jgi:hypothetical protein
MSGTRRPFGRGPFDGGGQSDGPDAPVVDFLRRTYAAPDDLDYWTRLERRVMAGVSGSADALTSAEWWQPFAGWVRMGLAAAGLAAIVAGAALMQSRAAEGSAAYAAVLDAPVALPALQASAREPRSHAGGARNDPQLQRRLETEAEAARAREATLRFVISH